MDTMYRKVRFLILVAVSYGFLSVWGQDPVKDLSDYESVAHINRGCPENSDCDPAMGAILSNWNAFIKSTTKKTTKDLSKDLAAQVDKYGWPTTFLARPAIKSTLGPALFDSNCPEHRKPNSPPILMRAIGLSKGVTGGEAIFQKGDSQYRLRLGETVFFQQVALFDEGKDPVVYYFPLGEKPSFRAGDQLVAVVEYENFYALLSSGPEGKWSIQPAGVNVSGHLSEPEDVPCPKNALPLPFGFSKSFCQKITDQKGKAAGIIQVFWSCG